MPTKSSASRIFKKTTRVYYYLLVLMLLILVACSLLSNQIGPIVGNDPNTNYILKLVLYFLAALAVFVAFYFPSKIIKRLTVDMTVEAKLIAYKRAQFFRFATFSIASIVVSLFFLLTANGSILLVQAIILLFVIIYKPSAFKVKSDLMLTDAELSELFNTKEV